MHCSQCGKRAEGKFCWQCGAALEPPTPPADWQFEQSYETLIRVPEVREAIAAHAGQARPGITGEQYLAMADKLIPMGVSLELLAAIVQPLYASWGIGMSRRRQERIDAPIGRVLLRVLCSLAAQGQKLRTVEQAADGCHIMAALPSDLWSMEGDLLIGVRGVGAVTEVEAATKIKGQYFDWGKSNQRLATLFRDLTTIILPTESRFFERAA
jgi:hypothetical protein